MRLYRRTILAALVAIIGIVFLQTAHGNGSSGEAVKRLRPASCPPFFLRDDYGLIIDPVANPDTAAAYSPRRTCGACHDYGRITGGYHFQMGADILTDDFGGKDKPWTLSDGPFGKFDLTYNRQLAPKDIPSPSHADMGVYEWVMECGICHPGGARAERDRNGHRYDDLQTTDSELTQLLDGDYYGARWDESGVIEADCLICHLSKGYNYGIRVGQMLKGNFRWAATAAAGLGGIAGSVRDNEVPRVHYNARLFNVDGKIDLPITRPDDRSCTHCHDQSGYEKTGTTWGDHYNQGVHTKSGIRCIDCHPGDIDHNFAKGDTNNLTLRDDLDGSMRLCEDCHTNGDLGAPKMIHRGLPQIHLDRIACETCHIPYKRIAAKGVIDYSTGTALAIPVPDTANAVGDIATWTPTYKRDEDDKIRPYNMLLPVWWGHKEGDLIHPLFLKEVKAALDKIIMKSVEDSKPEKVTAELIRKKEQALFAEFDDNGDGKPELNTEKEIAAIASALKETLRGKRFADPHPVLVKGMKVFEADSDGTVKSYSHKQAEPVFWALEHNVAPRGQSLGSNSCDECHSKEAYFFFGSVKVDPFDTSGRPVTKSMMTMLGLTPADFTPNGYVRLPRHDRQNYPAQFYAARFMALLLWVVFIFFAVHTLLWLPALIRDRKSLPRHGFGTRKDKTYQRFSPVERFLHVLVVVSFLGLAVTGMSQKFAGLSWGDRMLGLLGGVETAQLIHRICAVITLFYFLVHVLGVVVNFVSTRESKYDFFIKYRSLIPMPRDFLTFFRNVKWFLGLGPKPEYDRWNYWEKFDYFAVYWGVLLIGLTGLLMWVPKLFAGFVPGWTFGVARIVHSDEAVLAVVYIFTVHFLNSHLKPGRFPIDTSIFTGRVSLAQLQYERSAEYARLLETGALDSVKVEPARAWGEALALVFGYAAVIFGLAMLVLTLWGLIAG